MSNQTIPTPRHQSLDSYAKEALYLIGELRETSLVISLLVDTCRSSGEEQIGYTLGLVFDKQRQVQEQLSDVMLVLKDKTAGLHTQPGGIHC